MADMFKATPTSKSFRLKMEMKPFGNQLVDIIVPFYGQYNKVVNLMQGLLYNTSVVNFRVCLVDDCSPNKVFSEAAFESAPNVKVVRNSSCMGFGASLEIGMRSLEKESVFPWVVFMHSDVVVEDPNWLLFLGQSMLNLKGMGVKMVSAKTDNPVSNNPYLLKNDDKNDIILESGYLPLYCALCHRDLLSRVGVIKHYPYMGYEDREFGERMRHYGFKQGISGKSWVKHEGGATLKHLEDCEPEKIAVIKKNKNLFNEDLKNLSENHK